MQKRKKKLVLPHVQLKLVTGFFCCSALAVIVQSLVLHYFLAGLAEEIPKAQAEISMHVPRLLAMTILMTFALLAPLTLFIGINLSFPIVGPMRRFERFLLDTLDGKNPPDCSIRETDELQEFCRLINLVTKSSRTGSASTDEPSPEDLGATSQSAA